MPDATEKTTKNGATENLKKDRSPNYPAIGLPTAIELAKALWEKARRQKVPAEVAAKAMGFNKMTGAVGTKLAALKQYGLLEGRGSGGFGLTDRAVTIIQFPVGSTERGAAINEAANAPDLFRELYPNAESSNDVLKPILVTKKHFSEGGADQLIKAFRDTLALVNGSGTAYIDPGGDSMAPPPGEQVGQIPPKNPLIPLGTGSFQEKKGRTYSWPLSDDVVVNLSFSGEITTDHVEVLEAYLQIVKKALARKVQSPS